MTQAFERLAEEYLRIQPGSGGNAVRVVDIICPETLSLEQAGLRTPQTANTGMRLKGQAAYDDFTNEFVQQWDPETYNRAQAYRNNNLWLPSNWLHVKPITVVELRHPDTMGRTSLEARSRFSAKHALCSVAIVAVGPETKSRKLERMQLELPLRLLGQWNNDAHRRISELWFRKLQQFGLLAGSLGATANQKLAAQPERNSDLPSVGLD